MDINPSILTIDAYIGAAPDAVKPLLMELRAVIRSAAPEAQEKISYKMPAFFQNGPLVYFAAFSHHIGFFPTASGIEAFEEELKGYDTAKGTVRFPFGKPIPYELVSRIVRFKVEENTKKAKK